MSIIRTESGSDTGSVTTGNVYSTYVRISSSMGYNVLTQRMVANFISELDMLGIITARVKSFGRLGRTREIEKVSENIVDILEKDEIFSGVDFNAFKSGRQTQFNIDS